MGLRQEMEDFEAAIAAGKVKEWRAGEWSPRRDYPTDPSAREGLSTPQMERLRGD
jgi:hypothetical protein